MMAVGDAAKRGATRGRAAGLLVGAPALLAQGCGPSIMEQHVELCERDARATVYDDARWSEYLQAVLMRDRRDLTFHEGGQISSVLDEEQMDRNAEENERNETRIVQVVQQIPPDFTYRSREQAQEIVPDEITRDDVEILHRGRVIASLVDYVVRTDGFDADQQARCTQIMPQRYTGGI